MIGPETIEKISLAILPLPDQTQLSIAVVKDKEVCFAGIEKKGGIVIEATNSDSAFEIGSVTKAFTGNILAQMVLQGVINLDESVQDFLPFPVAGNPPVTFRQLAMHTSGLPRLPGDFFSLPDYEATDPYKSYTEKRLIAYLTKQLKLDSPPGQKYQYSNLGMGLLGYIISKIEGKPFAAIVDERIFKPLKMNDSGFDITNIKTNCVKGIDKNGHPCSYWSGGILNGCLGIISTARDLVKFAAAMTDLDNAAGNLQANETFSIEPQASSNLGWSERLFMPENIRMQGINGGTDGSGASILMNRKTNCSVVVLSNIAPEHYMEVIYPLNKELLFAASGLLFP